MMNCKMKQLALAVGMAVGGIGLLPSAQAVNVSSDNLGQALIFPYYTVRGGWNTLVGVTNTSDKWVAVRVRFREAWDSRDVQDFVLVLSPKDLWNATVYDTESGPVLSINPDETTCTIGLSSKTEPFPLVDGAPISYSGSVDRMREGYLEMIMMGAGDEGVVPSCATLVKNFMGQNINYDTALSNLRGWFNQYPANPLKGTFSLVNASHGYNSVGLPTALANFRSTTAITLHQPPSLPITPLITTTANKIGYADSWHEPSMNSADNAGSYFNSAGVYTTSLNNLNGGAGAVSDALQATALLNEWTHNPTGATAGGQSFVTATDWVITFPTKNFHVDTLDAGEYSGRASARTNLPPSPPDPFSSPFNGSQSCDVIKPTVYDRNEHTVDIQYPSPSGRFQICHEVNVLTFNSDSMMLSSPDTVIIPYDSSQFLYGWMNVGFNAALPAIGFSITSRQSVDDLLTEAALYNDSIVRP